MSLSTGYKGRDALLKMSANGGSTFTVIGGARTTGMTLNNNPVDISNSNSGGFRELLADGGLQSISVNVEGVVISDTEIAAMVTQTKDRTTVYYRLEFGNAGVITGRFVIAAFAESGAVDGAQTFTATLESTGALTITAPS